MSLPNSNTNENMVLVIAARNIILLIFQIFCLSLRHQRYQRYQRVNECLDEHERLVKNLSLMILLEHPLCSLSENSRQSIFLRSDSSA